jgi:hypothetical protein
MIRTFFKRETTGFNHTYEVDLKLNNLSPDQLKNFKILLDILELEGIMVTEYECQND